MLLVAVLVAASLPQRPPLDCQAHLDELHSAYYERYNSGSGEWSDLDPLIAQAHRCYEDARTAEHAQVFNYETSNLVKQRRYAEAEAVFERFFDGYASVAAPEVVARMHRRRGYIYERLGWTVAMLVEFNKAAALVDQLSPAEAAATLRNVGEQYRLVNDFETAKRHFTRAESLLVELYNQDPELHGPELGIVRLRQANVAQAEGESGERPEQQGAQVASSLIESALSLLPPTPEHAYYRSRALLSQAEVYWTQGQPERALTPVAEAKDLAPLLQESYAALVAMAWRYEGQTHLLLGHHAAARQAYSKALERAQAGQEHEESMWALLGLGSTFEAAAGLAHDLYPAEHCYRQAAALAERLRRSYGTHDWSTSAWADTQEPYLHLTRVLLRQGRPVEAFLTLDETRARYLRDLRAVSRLRGRLDMPRAVRLDSLSAALDSIRYALREDALTLATRSALEAHEMVLQRHIDDLMGAAETTAPPLTLEAVQRALRPRQQVLLTYFLDDDLPTAFVVRADTFVAVPLDVSAGALQSRVQQVSERWAQNGPEVAMRLTPLHALYEAVYAPVASLVPSGAPLLVIPDEPLTQVPFGMLLEHAHPPFDYADAPYLLRRHPIATELAAALLVEPPPTTDPSLDLLALGRCRFQSGGAGGSNADTLADLPNVREELRQLRHYAGSTRLAIDEAATETFFYAHRDEARIIHLASHALVDVQHPLYSRIILSEDQNHEEDGILYLYELQNRPLKAHLVTLSGCSTARGQRHIGEGMVGLQYAFRAAGARATLATLWQVDDATTAEVMAHFYQHLRRGLPKDEALRQAQLEYLDAHGGVSASPFFWAPLVLYGDPAPVALSARAPSAALWMPLGLLLLLGGIALPRLVPRLRSRRSRGG